MPCYTIILLAFLRVIYSEELKKEIVARHNDLRATECAVDMPVMQWSEALAEMGGRVADRCHAGHSGEGIPGTEGWRNNKTFHGFAYAGENAHWSGNIGKWYCTIFYPANTTGCFDTLAPPLPQSNLALVHISGTVMYVYWNRFC